ncbi:hypothetical protein GH733_007995 [Mirounga leonina]|nr:hypothetical protein GH733_007995 [Mirounga leonina]
MGNKNIGMVVIQRNDIIVLEALEQSLRKEYPVIAMTQPSHDSKAPDKSHKPANGTAKLAFLEAGLVGGGGNQRRKDTMAGPIAIANMDCLQSPALGEKSLLGTSPSQGSRGSATR